ncbi:GntR family transcriptional regulator [Streptomyces sp. NPDC058045]|uniref:GntR family transcriptional regulator n=1 Tax=Streptomyces sp. NPDC058045 TaxID=3346311 RepID=UPI0036E7FED4
MASTTMAPDGAHLGAEATVNESVGSEIVRTQLRGALLNFARLSSRFSMDLNSRGEREAVRGFIAPWVPAAEDRRKASGSPADEARWQKIIADVQPPEDEADLLSLTIAGRTLLRALLEALRPGPSVRAVADYVRASIANGAYPPGSSTSAGRIATEMGCPRAILGRVQLALADLEAEGLVTFPQPHRVRVGGEEAQPLDRVAQTADWLRLLIQAGVYLPAHPLPTRSVLGRALVTPEAIVTQAIGALHVEKIVTAYRGSRVIVRPELPFKAAEPPDLDRLVRRLEAAALPDADLRPTRIRELCQQSRTWWHTRFTPHPEVLTQTFRALVAAAAHLVPLAASRYPGYQEVQPVLRRTAVTALTELPQDSDTKVWRTAVLGAAVREVLILLPDAGWPPVTSNNTEPASASRPLPSKDQP